MRPESALTASPSWNYTTFLNLAFIALIAVLFYRFVRTGGPEMLRMMAQPGHGGGHGDDHGHDHGHDHAQHGDHEHHQH